MRARIGSNGEVVIPKAVRDRVGLRPGDESYAQAWAEWEASGEADGADGDV